jgi:dephospho-CoA kinase
MGSGKSEVAKHLVNNHRFKLIKFAAPLKDMTRVLLHHLGVHHSDVERHVEGDLKEHPVALWDRSITARRIMQTLGTEWRNMIDHDLWIEIARERIETWLTMGHNVVVDDMRFEHEMRAILEMGGRTVRVFRDGVKVTSKHSSEGSLDAFNLDFNISNNGTLDDLYGVVDKLMEKLNEQR